MAKAKSPMIYPAGCMRVDMKASDLKWLPRPRYSSLQWMMENLKMPKRLSPFEGFWSMRRFPYQAGILDLFDDIDVRILSLQWATQTGKTTLVPGLILKVADTDPSPMMHAGPDRNFEKETSNERIMLLAEGIPRIKEKLLPDKMRDAFKPDFGDCCCYMGWSGSPTTLGGRACRYVFCSELSKWNRRKSEEADPAALVKDRVKMFYDSKIVFEGTPTVEGICRMEALGKAADQRLKYFMPCPHCGKFINFILGKRGQGLQFDRGKEKKLDVPLAEKTAWYQCQECGGKILDNHKSAMMISGVWAENGKHIPKGFTGRVYLTPGKSKRRIHTDLSSFYSPVLTFGDMAGAFCEAMNGEGNKNLQDFINGWLAEPWTPIVKTYQWQDVKKVLCVPSAPKETVPEWVKFLTGGVDPGKHASHWVVRGWGYGGRSRLISWGQAAHYNEKISFNEIEAMLFGRSFERGTEKLTVALAGIDSGYRTHDVYDWVLEMNEKYGECVRAIKGMKHARAPYFLSPQERTATDGKIIEGGMALWCINDGHWKEFITGKFKTPFGQQGAFELPADTDEFYLHSITAESLQEIKDKKGHVSYEWVVTDTQTGPHYLDAEKIGAVMADMCGWRELKPDSVVNGRAQIKPQSQRDSRGEESRGGLLDDSESYWDRG